MGANSGILNVASGPRHFQRCMEYVDVLRFKELKLAARLVT
jgi:hypothetical protein